MLEGHDRVPLTVLDDLYLFRTQILDRPPLRVGHLDVETCQLDTGREPRRVLLALDAGRPGGGQHQGDNYNVALHRVPISSPAVQDAPPSGILPGSCRKTSARAPAGRNLWGRCQYHVYLFSIIALLA